jgi:hypothetical protein
MADEEMRLRASFEDKLSPGLKASIEKIKAFTKEGQRAAEAGWRAKTGGGAAIAGGAPRASD